MDGETEKEGESELNLPKKEKYNINYEKQYQIKSYQQHSKGITTKNCVKFICSKS